MVRAVAAIVAAASLYSRLASFAVLAIAARVLTVYEFGILAVAVGAAIAVANTFAAGAGDQIAAQAVARPRNAWRFLVRSSAGLAGIAVMCSLIAFAFRSSPGTVLAASVSLCASTAICMTTMNYLRGTGRVAAGSLVAYVLLPTLRTAAVIALVPMHATTLFSAIMAINIASLTAATVGLLISGLSAHPAKRLSGQAADSISVRGRILVGVAIAAGWMTLSQGDITALAVFQGSVTAGEYTPTMRVLEALTALGIGIKFAGTRQMVEHPHSGLRSRLVMPLLAGYAISAGLCLLAAPTILGVTFGEAYRFNYAVAVLLIPAYLLSSLVAMLLQILIARGAGSRVATLTIRVIWLAVVLLAAGAASIGAVGVAAANLIVFAVWFAALYKLEIGTRSRDR